MHSGMALTDITAYLWYTVPSVLWRCWLGGRKGIRPEKKLSGEVLTWLSVWSEMQTCLKPSWCHCHSLSLASVKSRLILPFWYRPTLVVLEKRPLNGGVCVSMVHIRLRDAAPRNTLASFPRISIQLCTCSSMSACQVRIFVHSNNFLFCRHVANEIWYVKVKVAHTRLPGVGFRIWSRFLAVRLQVTWVTNPVVGCHYFPPGLQLPSQPLRGLLPISRLGEQRHDGCEQFAWDCYPTASRLRFEPRPFCAWVQNANHSASQKLI